MRTEDLARLDQPYPSVGRPERRFVEALGVPLPAVPPLHDAICSDLDEVVFGIGWWAPQPGTSRRILISDYLIQCVGSIPTNVVEARLHLLEALDCWERESKFVANALTVDREGHPNVRLPPRTKALDDLPHAMARLHVAGFFRSIIAALDCLGAAIIGVLALPVRILRADLDKARAALREAEGKLGAGEDLKSKFGSALSGFITDAGPPRWLAWTIAFRNMSVHRARRLQFTQLRPTTLLFGPDGGPVPRLEAIEHMTRDPGISDVEALVHRGRGDLVLAEPAEITLNGILSSTVRLLNGTAEQLVACWETRRSKPDLLAQPPQRWPEGPSVPEDIEFAGYFPGSIPVDPGVLIAGPDVPRRLKAAALSDDLRGNWQSFD